MKTKTKSDNIFDKSDVEIVSESFNFSALQGAKVLVTGANGTVGSLCVKSLVANGVNVVALIRNQDKANRIFQQELADKNLASKIAFLVQDIRTPISADLKVDYIIHCASETASKAFVEHPVETILTTLDGTKNILEFAKTCGVKGAIFLSSIEVYGERHDTKETFTTENDLGFLNCLDLRSSYPEAKRMAENLCVAYANQFGVPVKIARLTQILSREFSKDDKRLIIQFARAVKNKENIVLHTKGETARNYCYVADAVSAILTILTKGATGEAYNVANPNDYYSVYELAKLLENEHTKVVLEIDGKDRGYAKTNQLHLDVGKLQKLGWAARCPVYDEVDGEGMLPCLNSAL